VYPKDQTSIVDFGLHLQEAGAVPRRNHPETVCDFDGPVVGLALE
jgi:hypothetical protein